MVKLYGVKPSNYYSLVKAILIEKNIDFVEVPTPPSQDEDFLLKSPMGRMPAIEVNGTFLSESLAIAYWAEQVQPEPALLPQDPLAAAKVLELVYHIKLNVELVARRCLPAAFFGAAISDELRETTWTDLQRGMKAVDRIFVAEPFAAGSQLTLADFVTFYTFGLAGGIVEKIYDKRLLGDYAGIQKVMETMARHPSIARVELEKAA